MSKKFSIKCLKTLSECKEVWQLLTTNTTLYDTWELHYCFYKYFDFELYFYTGYVDNKLIGLLPLQYNSSKNYLEYFGDYNEWMDQNKIFILPEYKEYVSEFYKTITLPIKLSSFIGDDEFTKNFSLDNYTYFLPLNEKKSHEDYFNNYLSGKKRRNFNLIIRTVEKEGVEIVKNNLNDIENMFDLNIKCFGERSSFLYPFRKEIFRDLVNLPNCTPHLLTFKIKNNIEAVSFCLKYKDIFTALNAGANRELNFDLNSYVTFKEIDAAIATGAKIYDARGGDYGWKEKWHFEKSPQYKFEKL